MGENSWATLPTIRTLVVGCLPWATADLVRSLSFLPATFDHDDADSTANAIQMLGEHTYALVFVHEHYPDVDAQAVVTWVDSHLDRQPKLVILSSTPEAAQSAIARQTSILQTPAKLDDLRDCLAPLLKNAPQGGPNTVYL